MRKNSLKSKFVISQSNLCFPNKIFVLMNIIKGSQLFLWKGLGQVIRKKLSQLFWVALPNISLLWFQISKFWQIFFETPPRWFFFLPHYFIKKRKPLECISIKSYYSESFWIFKSESLRKKCLYSELFWCSFSCIRTEYREILRISSYSVQMRENVDQNNTEFEHFLRS